ncbi:Putative AC transposase [Linum perenne]
MQSHHLLADADTPSVCLAWVWRDSTSNLQALILIMNPNPPSIHPTSLQLPMSSYQSAALRMHESRSVIEDLSYLSNRLEGLGYKIPPLLPPDSNPSNCEVIGMKAGNGQAPNAPLVDPLHQAQAQVNGDQQPPPEQTVAAENGNQAAAEEALIMQSKRKSHVWLHFERVKINEVWKAKCNYCRKLLGGESNNGTSHLKSHIRTCIQKKIQDGNQKVLGPNLLSKGKTELVATAYNPEVSRKELAIAVVMHEYPMSIVDHLHFKRFCYSLQPMFSVPSRNTLKKDVMGLFCDERVRIQKFIDSNLGRVVVTTDMWTASNQRKGYMAVTAHYIDNGWCLRSQLLRFIYVPAPHTSDRLAKYLVECLMDWNVDSKRGNLELEGCFTGADYEAVSDDEPHQSDNHRSMTMRANQSTINYHDID